MTTTQQAERVRQLAESVGCLTELDVAELAGVERSTLEAWRKRGTGPSYVRFGNAVLYPREAVQAHLRALTRERLSARPVV